MKPLVRARGTNELHKCRLRPFHVHERPSSERRSQVIAETASRQWRRGPYPGQRTTLGMTCPSDMASVSNRCRGAHRQGMRVGRTPCGGCERNTLSGRDWSHSIVIASALAHSQERERGGSGRLRGGCRRNGWLVQEAGRGCPRRGFSLEVAPVTAMPRQTRSRRAVSPGPAFRPYGPARAVSRPSSFASPGRGAPSR
jgi:hypothetical protein